MKRRNAIAMQASGYTVSGMFATTSAVALVTGKGLSSIFYGALSAIAAAATNEIAADIVVDLPKVTKSESAPEVQPATETPDAPAQA